jgi:hypothetical protein
MKASPCTASPLEPRRRLISAARRFTVGLDKSDCIEPAARLEVWSNPGAGISLSVGGIGRFSLARRSNPLHS